MIERIHFPPFFWIPIVTNQTYFQRRISFHIDKITDAFNVKSDSEALKAAHRVSHQYLSHADSKYLDQWNIEKPFVQMTNPELLNLIYNHVTPLQDLLHSLMCELPKSKQDNVLWSSTSLDKLQKDTEGCLEQLRDFQEKLNKALWQRTQIPLWLGRERHHSRPLDYFTQDFSTPGLNLGKPKNLSDDIRIQIYDYLRQDSFQEALIESILAPIAAHPYSFLKAKHLRRHDQLRSSLQSLEQQLKKSEKPVARAPKTTTWLNRIHLKITRSTPWAWIQDLLHHMHVWRYVPYFLASFAMAFALTTALSPILSLIFSPGTVQTLSSLIFSSVALSPGFSYLWQKGQHIVNTLKTRCQMKHTSELSEALEKLNINQQCLEGELARGILDTPHFELSQISDLFKACDERVSYELSSPSAWMKFINPTLKKDIQATRALIKEQAQLLKERRPLFIKHLLDRLEADIPRLMHDPQRGLFPAMSSDQIKDISEFVHQQGSPKNRDQLNEILSLRSPLLCAFKTKTFQLQGSSTLKECSWGQCRPNRASLNGWLTLSENVKQSSVHTFIQLLMGQSHKRVSLKDLEKLTTNTELLPHIQDYIFSCLHDLPTHYVHLLSESQKQQILDWYEQHQAEIEAAREFLKELLPNGQLNLYPQPSVMDASKTVQLLDNALLAFELKGITGLNHDLRQYLSNYHGEHSLAFCLLRYFPDDERPRLLGEIAQKRVHWLLDNPQKAGITLQDQELFHSPQLHDSDCPFDFNATVEQHLCSGENQHSKQKLLKTFQSYGFYVPHTNNHSFEPQPNLTAIAQPPSRIVSCPS